MDHRDIDRFWAGVDRGGNDQCWLWRRGKNGAGRGYFSIGSRQVNARRFAWELENGPIPEGKQVHTRCASPSCCNPGHLYLRDRKPALQQKVFANIQVGRPDECWLWTGRKNRGYGLLGVREKGVLTCLRAHRVVYEIHYKCSILPGIDVCHKCDNPSCCNPGHLFLGTRADNNRDCREKGRATCGERSPHAKLSFAQVQEIRKRYAGGSVTQVVLAEEYGVTYRTVGRAVRGRSWKSSERP